MVLQTKKKGAEKMKNVSIQTIRSHYDKDGFLNGFLKGSAGTVLFFSIAALFTGCFGM